MTGTHHSRARARWMIAAGVAAVLVAAFVLAGREDAQPVQAAAPPLPTPPPMTVVPATVAGLRGCLTERGFTVVRATERSLVVSRDGARRAAVMIYPNEPAAQQAATEASGWEAIGNTRLRAGDASADARAALLGCLQQPLEPGH